MKQFLFSAIFMVIQQISWSQTNSLCVEASLNDLISSGFGISIFMDTEKHWSLGIGLGNTAIGRSAKDLVFDGDDLDALDIDLPFIVGLNARYFLRTEQKAWYAQLALGNEIFRIRADEEVQTNPNQFAVFSVGYLWLLKRGATSGFYINPRLGANFTWNSGGRYIIQNNSYELRTLFPNPGITVGWKF